MGSELDELIERVAKARAVLDGADIFARAAISSRDSAETRLRNANRDLDRAITARIDAVKPDDCQA